MTSLLLPYLFLCILFFSLLSASNAPQRRRRWNCGLRRSYSGMVPGVPRNKRAQCKYNPADDTFYQHITWKSPVEGEQFLKGYMMRIYYVFWSLHLCFHFNSSVNQFNFDAAEGFKHGLALSFAVTAEPVVDRRKIITKLQRTRPCPLELELRPIQNKYVIPGANTSFQCAFVEGRISSVDSE